MERRALRGVLLDYCAACRAVWLDAGELEDLERGRKRPREALERDARAEAAGEARSAVSSLDVCPRCQRALEATSLSGVEVDRCRGCGGLFFDHGELQTLLKRQRGGRLARWLQRRRD